MAEQSTPDKAQPPQEALVDAAAKSHFPVDHHDRDAMVKLFAQVWVGVDVDQLWSEAMPLE